MTHTMTCGPLYRGALLAYTDMSPEQIRLFSSGFMTGQAEKVSLGTCPAAMFRPSPEYYDMLAEVVRDISQRYGLKYRMLGNGEHREIWLYHQNASPLVYALHRFTQPNSEPWHALRALLCGIPTAQIDLHFHHRQGVNRPCDRPEEHV